MNTLQDPAGIAYNFGVEEVDGVANYVRLIAAEGCKAFAYRQNLFAVL